MHNIKLFRQTSGFCGPSSVRIILKFYGLTKTEKEIANAIGATRKNGCAPEQIILGVKKFGLTGSYQKRVSLSSLKKIIKNSPVIIYWNRNGEGHYSVVYNVSNRVFIADPKLKRKISLPINRFLDKWKDPNSNDYGEIIVIRQR
jgi:predicted double-glycine peptidase